MVRYCAPPVSVLLLTLVSLTACNKSKEDSKALSPTARFSDTGVRSPDQQTQYKAVNGILNVYDACQEKWIDTTLPYREEPTFPDIEVSKDPWRLGFKYTSEGEKYQLFDVDGTNIEKYIKPGGANVPASFRGIFWMESNPTPEIIVTLANAKYEPEARLIDFQYNTTDAYLFPSSYAGIAMWDTGIAVGSHMQIRIPKEVDLDHPKYVDTVFANISLKWGAIVNELQPATYIADGLWRRNSAFDCYNFRRIVDENGKKLPVYDYFVKKLPDVNKAFGSSKGTTLIIPRKVQ